MTLSPRPPTLHQLLRTISLYSRWSSSGSDRGIAHFLTATRNTIEGVGEKEQTNKRKICLGLTQVQKGSYVTLWICRLTLAWISSENSTTLMECRLISPHCGWTLSQSTGISAVRCRLPLSVVPRQLPNSQSLCLTLWLTSPSYFRSPRVRGSKPFVWFRAKTDKGIVCLADHLHSVTIRRICFRYLLMFIDITFSVTVYVLLIPLL